MSRMIKPTIYQSDAIIDETGRYRYSLIRIWDEARPRICWIMLNPSTADAVMDDPTIRKCIGFAQRWGYGSIEVVNLFAYRSRFPEDLFVRGIDPIGPENDRYITEAVRRADKVVAAWGINSSLIDPNRAVRVVLLLEEADCLGCTKDGSPKHPLYLRADTPLEPYWRT